jgi:cytosine deaminase
MAGPRNCGHTCALAAYPDDYAATVIEKVARAGIHMISNPATNLMLQGRLDRQPVQRGITRVRELIERGANVSFGQDCVCDTFYPFGKDDPLEIAFLMAHAAHMSMPFEIEKVFEMPLTAAARVLRLKQYGLRPGDRADVVIIDAADATEAIRYQSPRRWVVKRGQLISETMVTRKTAFQDRSVRPPQPYQRH